MAWKGHVLGRYFVLLSIFCAVEVVGRFESITRIRDCIIFMFCIGCLFGKVLLELSLQEK